MRGNGKESSTNKRPSNSVFVAKSTVNALADKLLTDFRFSQLLLLTMEVRNRNTRAQKIKKVTETKKESK